MDKRNRISSNYLPTIRGKAQKIIGFGRPGNNNLPRNYKLAGPTSGQVAVSEAGLGFP
jgi:hypothetical protein